MEMEYRETRQQPEFDIMEYWRVIVKRKGVLITFAATVVLLIGLYSFVAPPKYKPSVTLLIGEQTSKMLSIEDEFGLLNYRSQLKEQVFVNTQLQLLQSESLAERVARKLELLSRPEFGAGKEDKKNLFAGVVNLITFKWLKSKKGEEDSLLEDPYIDLLEKFQKAVDVSQVRDTKILKISYTSKYPRLATEIVNTLAEEFIGFSIEKRYEATQQATDFLSEQITGLRRDLAAKERDLQKYGEEKELYFLSNEESTVLKKLADLSEAYTQAQIARVKAESEFRGLEKASVDALPRTTDNQVIQRLQEEYARIKNEFREKSQTFKPDYPAMVKLAEKRESMREGLQSELDSARNAAELKFNSVQQEEYRLKRLLDQTKNDVARINSSAIFYNSLKIEVENMQKLLDSLTEKQKNTQLSARLSGLKTSNISIVDRARVPKDPVSPKKKLNLILALLMGLFGGVGLCFVFEYLDNTVKGPDDVERLAGLPSLGVIPFLPPEGIDKKKQSLYYTRYRDVDIEPEESKESLPEIKEIELINFHFPSFSISEDYRTIRTSILLSSAGNEPKTLAVVSALAQEGKTATAANMAISFAQLEKRVLLIDADLRRPRLHRIFEIANTKGLSGYLAGKFRLEDIIFKSGFGNIWVIPSGPIPPNPAELLNSKGMKTLLEGIKKGFTISILDTPPVLAVVDAVVVSAIVDGVVLVTRPDKTTKKPFLRAVSELRQAKAKITGVLFNGMDIHDKAHYYHYYSRHYYREIGEDKVK